MINWQSWLLWGFISTIALSTLSAASQGLGLSRMNLPFMLGTMVTPDRDRARFYGFAIHAFVGWIFSLVYVLMFHALGQADWARGAVIGACHGLFVLVVGMTAMPGIHPRMASEQQGPTATRLLEPPGFMAMHYGVQTPLAVLISHTMFGIILGAFYQLPK
jgi:uncharacterized membrane protein YagU involved in acid resistance